MAVTPVNFVAPQQIANSATTYYTSTSIKSRIDALSVANPTAGAVTVTIYIVPSGGAVGDSTTLVKTRSIAAGETWTGLGVVGQIMPADSTLRAVASAATSLTLMASGVQIS